ncbi:MAG: hypothetical protein IJF66_03620 [Clostridia bacterium]|nr:hypothetical protein [Clostridia bacterium]
MYCKRILIIQQSNPRFAERNRELCGMVKLINNASATTEATIFVTNADIQAIGEWWILFNFNGVCFAKQIINFNNQKMQLVKQDLQNVGCLLVKKEKYCYEAGRASSGNMSLCDTLFANMDMLVQAGKEQTITVPTEAPTQYEQFVASTNNFYPNVDLDKLHQKAGERYKSVQEYSQAFERYYAAGAGADYYKSVQQEIVKVFVQFPPYYPLIKKYANSYFVRIDFPSSEKYFVMGVLQQDKQVKYICYGLPAQKEPLQDKDFSFVEDTPTSFWMLFQDATTGQITTNNTKY